MTGGERWQRAWQISLLMEIELLSNRIQGIAMALKAAGLKAASPFADTREAINWIDTCQESTIEEYAHSAEALDLKSTELPIRVFPRQHRGYRKVRSPKADKLYKLRWLEALNQRKALWQ